MKHHYNILYKTYLQYLPAVLFCQGSTAEKSQSAIKSSHYNTG